ncbi:MAG: CopG family transcriptional regulator [Acidobacteriota bacterium]|jgi:hypothetical protein|nr:CopG family transcriptional regulator [Acidobacteriota bacterium]
MNSRIKYTDEPMGKVRIVDDFLPSPGELAFREDNVKVTISLSRNSLDFFKEQAALHKTPYQKMIRNLLDAYVGRLKSEAAAM